MVRRIIVGDLERVLLVRKGQFQDILGPGVYWLSTLGGRIHVERHSLNNPEFASEWADQVLRGPADVLQQWFTSVTTNEDQIALVYANGELHRVLGPGKRMLLWRGAFAYRVELFDIRMNPEVPARLVPALAKHPGDPCATFVVVEEGKRGLLFVGGRFRRELPPGTHAFWKPTLLRRVDTFEYRQDGRETTGRAMKAAAGLAGMPARVRPGTVTPASAETNESGMPAEYRVESAWDEAWEDATATHS